MYQFLLRRGNKLLVLGQSSKIPLLSMTKLPVWLISAATKVLEDKQSREHICEVHQKCFDISNVRAGLCHPLFQFHTSRHSIIFVQNKLQRKPSHGAKRMTSMQGHGSVICMWYP